MNKKERVMKKYGVDLEGRTLLYLTQYGSFLYGTATEDSDLDLKGVFLPSKREILLQSVPKSLTFNTKSSEKGNKNTAGDVDVEIYSLGYFLKLALQGQTVALEMMWALGDGMNVEHALEYVDPLFVQFVLDYREKFLTKEMKAFLGYARAQAVKYSNKGNRYSLFRKMVDWLQEKERFYPDATLAEMVNEEFYDHFQEEVSKNEVRYKTNEKSNLKELDVSGKKVPETASVSYALSVFKKSLKSYGNRSKESEKGFDWKAMSHAYRVASELEDLYRYGYLVFPLKYAETLKKVKRGEYSFEGEFDKMLEQKVDTVQQLAKNNDYPEKVNRDMVKKMWDYAAQQYENVVKE